jgi:hypothetical protein
MIRDRSCRTGSKRDGAAIEANARRDAPDWRAEATVCAARSNIAITTGAFADAARLAEQAADLARAGGDLADASVELTYATSYHLLLNDAPAAVRPAREALALARQTGAPALIATGLLALGAAVAGTDPKQARACLRESRELSTALGHHSAVDLLWATAIAFLLGDQAATLEFGRRAIRGFQGAGRIRMALVLYMIAGVLLATRSDAAAIILGAAEAYVVESPQFAALSSIVTASLGKDRARELRTRGAGLDWDQAVAYTLTQITQALSELQPETQP